VGEIIEVLLEFADLSENILKKIHLVKPLFAPIRHGAKARLDWSTLRCSAFEMVFLDPVILPHLVSVLMNYSENELHLRI